MIERKLTKSECEVNESEKKSQVDTLRIISSAYLYHQVVTG